MIVVVLFLDLLLVLSMLMFFSACRFCCLEGTNTRYVYTLETRSFSELRIESRIFTCIMFTLIMSEQLSFIHMICVLASVFVTNLS